MQSLMKAAAKNSRLLEADLAPQAANSKDSDGHRDRDRDSKRDTIANKDSSTRSKPVRDLNVPATANHRPASSRPPEKLQQQAQKRVQGIAEPLKETRNKDTLRPSSTAPTIIPAQPAKRTSLSFGQLMKTASKNTLGVDDNIKPASSQPSASAVTLPRSTAPPSGPSRAQSAPAVGAPRPTASNPPTSSSSSSSLFLPKPKPAASAASSVSKPARSSTSADTNGSSGKSAAHRLPDPVRLSVANVPGRKPSRGAAAPAIDLVPIGRPPSAANKAPPASAQPTSLREGSGNKSALPSSREKQTKPSATAASNARNGTSSGGGAVSNVKLKKDVPTAASAKSRALEPAEEKGAKKSAASKSNSGTIDGGRNSSGVSGKTTASASIPGRHDIDERKLMKREAMRDTIWGLLGVKRRHYESDEDDDDDDMEAGFDSLRREESKSARLARLEDEAEERRERERLRKKGKI
ncbi:hypothetical protein HDU82_006929 [Entophlyctis luteolus]|nr:hypothetical protein HDU82_006929 [Entophlyctis luteolus]